MIGRDELWHRYLRQPYRLRVARQGNPENPTIVLLHGIAASASIWDNLIPLLTPDYYCVTIDLVGFGDSPKPQWYTYDMDDHIRSIRRTIRSEHLRGDFILAGHSLGSLLTTRYASRWPRHISRVLLLSPPVYNPLDTADSSWLAKTRNDILLKIYKFLRSHRRMTPDNFRRLSRIAPLPKTVITDPDTWVPFMLTLEHCIEQQTIAEDILRITAPLDIFYGSLDQVVIARNIQRLTLPPDAVIHRIAGVNHDLGKRYARVVSDMLRTAA